MAKLTMIGMSNYMRQINNDLFKELSIPEEIDKETLIDTILLRCGEFECIYSNPQFVQKVVGVWSTSWYRTFDKWVKALALEYDPISNYDRNETWTETGSSNTSNTGGGTVTNKKSAYNSSTFENDTESVSSDSATANASNSVTHTARVSGNIGVTTSQQMLQSELDIAMFNIYEHITDIFVREFCIPIY